MVDTHRTSDFTALRVEVEDDIAPRENAVENQQVLSSKVKWIPKLANRISDSSLGNIY